MSNPYQPILDELRSTFESDVTKDLKWRKDVLNQLLKMFTEGDNLQKWTSAFISDLGGGEVRALLEVNTIVNEIKHCLSTVDEWAADRPAPLMPTELPGIDKRVVRPTPKGVTLTMGAWNFPMNLLFVPALNALTAGNCCLLKPSELAPATSQLCEDLVHKYLPTNAVRVVQGGIPETTDILALRYDHITITGSSFVGKIVMKAAAEHLTPCTLELGGKNPTFVDSSADLDMAADRMVLSKATNAGQWCVDVDYVLVDETVADQFADKIVASLKKMVGDETQQRGENIPLSQQWCNRIINERNTQRLKSYLEEDHGGKVIVGGLEYVDVEKKFFPLTVVVNPKEGSKLMTEEIFGPILVIKTVANVDEAISIMKSIYDTPLALYVYSNDKAYTEKVLMKCTSGSVGVNTTCDQALESEPFGGIGQSGMGAYHGKTGFDEYSHLRHILYRTSEGDTFVPEAIMARQNVFPAKVKDDFTAVIKN